MSDKNKKPETETPVADSNEPVVLTRGELKALLSEAKQSNEAVMAEALKALSNSILESRKPYKDPRQEENDKLMREQSRELHKRIEEQIKLSRETCPHLQGSNPLSDVAGQLSSFILHYLDNGLVVGICTNCQLTIYSDSKDPAVQRLFQMKSGNKMSQSGRRVFRDPLLAMEEGRLETCTLKHRGGKV